MNYITFFLLAFIVISTLQFGIFFKSAWKSLWTTKFPIENYSDYSNSVSVVLSTILFALPLFLFSYYKNLESTTYLNDAFFLIILISTTIFFILLDKKVFWSKEFRKPLNPPINEKIQKLEIEVDNKIEQNNQISNNLVKSFNRKFLEAKKITLNNRNEIVSLSWKLYHTNRELQNTTLTVFKNHRKSKSELEQIGKQVQEITKKFTSKPRESKRLDEKEDIIYKQFTSLIEHLRRDYPNYNHQERCLECFGKYDLTELQAYQTLIAYFRENYNVPLENTLASMFRIFNDHFNIKEKKLKSNNWSDFKNRLLPEMENNTFYSDLCLFINK